MPEWEFVGYDRRERFEKELSPDELLYTLKQYQKVFGQKFGLQELLELERIKALALIAEAINDVPEFLLHHVGKAEKYGVLSSFSDAIESIAEAIQEK